MGNTQGKKIQRSENEARSQQIAAANKYVGSPGSPLTYIPQTPMEPFGITPSTPTSQFYNKGQQGPDINAVAGWPATPKLVPTVITWTNGGDYVEIEGSFDDWKSREPMQKSGKYFTIVKLLAPGVYQYKFVVDGVLRYDPSKPVAVQLNQQTNNILEVQENVPENLQNLTDFEPPSSPIESYNNPIINPEDLQKDPPLLPPHLQLTLLNVPPAMDTAATLPRPQHVILNHLYCMRGCQKNMVEDIQIIGATHRYKSKFVTCVMYKPKTRRY